MRNSQRTTEVRQYNKSNLPRLRWTPELHEHFAAVVESLGGKYEATPKRIMQMMDVKGLKISHIKSHLQMYRSTKRCNDDDEIIAKEQLRAQTPQFSDHGALSIGSPQSQSQSQRQIGDGLFIDFECRSENFKHELAFSEDCRDIHGKRRNEEEYGSLDEICELSLSFTPMEMDQEQEEREFWPLTDGQSRLSTTSIDNNFPDFHSLGTNHHLNLDLTI